NLEANTRSRTDDFLKVIAGQNKKTAHWIADICTRYPCVKRMSKIAQNDPVSRKLAHAATSSVTRGHYKVETLRFELRKHLRQDPLVMLEVSIHYRNIWRGGCHHP